MELSLPRKSIQKSKVGSLSKAVYRDIKVAEIESIFDPKNVQEKWNQRRRVNIKKASMKMKYISIS